MDKIGRMTPNLRELSLKGLNMCTQTLFEITTRLTKLEIVDISCCRTVEEKAVIEMAQNNP